MAARNRIDLTDKRFGRLVVLKATQYFKDGLRWECQCDCGTTVEVRSACLRNGMTRSCGCLKRGKDNHLGRISTTHGLSHKVPEYRTWVDMRRRCDTPSQTSYKRYGALGIRVCELWDKSFVAFYSDMGPKPTPRHTIDRINPFGNYEPDNCRWATYKEQSANTKKHWLARHAEHRL